MDRRADPYQSRRNRSRRRNHGLSRNCKIESIEIDWEKEKLVATKLPDEEI